MSSVRGEMVLMKGIATPNITGKHDPPFPQNNISLMTIETHHVDLVPYLTVYKPSLNTTNHSSITIYLNYVSSKSLMKKASLKTMAI